MPVLTALVLAQLLLKRWALDPPPSDLLWSVRTDGLFLGVMIALSLNIQWVRVAGTGVLERDTTFSGVLGGVPLLLMSALAAERVVWFGTGLIAVLGAWLHVDRVITIRTI